MKITSVDLKISAVRRSQYPTDGQSEYLLVGKSNVGKRSFINTLINRKKFYIVIYYLKTINKENFENEKRRK